MARKGHLTRSVTTKECHWLEKDLKKGKVVYEYKGYTYGVIGAGIAVSDKPGISEPFYEIPRNAVAWGK